MSEARRIATYEDLFDLPDNVIGEILDGEVCMSPRPRPRHAQVASQLGAHITVTFSREPDNTDGTGGWWILDEPELHLEDQVLVPDIAGWRRERLPQIPDVVGIELAPDWVCEVISPSTARIDRLIKKRIYAEQGVEFVWLVDPMTKTLEVLQRQPSGLYQEVEVYAGDVKARVVPFEALELDLRRWWGMG